MAVTVTRSRSLVNDADGDGQPDPGDVFLHTIIITNGDPGSITNVQLEETEEGYTISPGSVEIGPIAVDDTLASISGNTPVAITTAMLIGNDLDPDDVTPSLTITRIGTTPLVYNAMDSAPIAVTNGTVVHHGDGTFTFTPNTGFAGAASFTYEITDDQGQTSVTATPGVVNITVTDPVWYVDNTNGSDVTGDGSYANPFASLNPLSTGGSADALDNASDTIFVYDNGGTAGGTIVLEASQKLFGDSHSFTVNGISIGASTSNSAIGGGGTGTIVTLSTGNQIDGIDITGTGTATGLGGASFGTFTVDNTTIDTVDRALNLATGVVAGAGFTSTDSDGGTNNVSLTAVTGTLNLGTGTLTGASGSSVNIDGGTANVDYNGAVTQSNNAALLNVINHGTGTVSLDGTLNATNGTGLQYSNADGTYNVTGTVTLNGGVGADTGVDILVNSAGTFSFGAGTTITHASAGDAFVVDNSNATVTYSGSIADVLGNAVNINNHDAGTITFQTGTITATGGTGGGIDVTNSGGGTINFNGAVTLNTGANGAVTMTGNAGSAINFSGAGTGLDITTTSGDGFSFDGGTLGIAGSGNTITTTTGQVIDLNGILAAGGATFASLDGGTTVEAAIALNNVTGGAFNGGAVNIAGTTIGNHTVSISSTASAVTISSGNIGGAFAGSDTVNINGGSGNVTIGAALAKSTDGHIVEVNGHSSGTVSFTGNLNSSAASDGILINSSGGTIGFSGTTKTLGTTSAGNNAVTLTSNTGAVSFTGGNLDIDTTTGTGVAGTGGGTLAISGTGNTITAVGGRAFSLDGPDSAGITLQSVSANGGGSTAIFLQNAGTGGFTITGTGSTAGSGGTINAITGDTGDTTEGIGVYVANTNNVSLSNMNFTGNTTNYNIRGSNVTNFTLRDSSLSAGTTVGDAVDEGNIRFTNLDGVGLFEGNSIEDAFNDALVIVNTENTLLNLFVRDTAGGDAAVFGPNSSTDGNDIISVETQNDASARILVDGVQFTAWRGDAVNTRALGTSNVDLTVQNSAFANTHGSVVTGGGIGVLVGGTAGGGSWGVDYTIQDNTFTGADGYAIAASFNGNGGTIRGFIDQNIIGDNDGIGENTGSKNGGIYTRLENSGGAAGSLTEFVTISNNQIRDIGSSGIKVDSVNTGNTGNPTKIEATVNNNIVEDMYNSGAGINIAGFHGLVSGDATDTSQIGLDMNNNTFDITNTTQAYAPIFFQGVSLNAQYFFPGYSGQDGPNNGPITAYLTARGHTFVEDPGQLAGPGVKVFVPDAVMNPGALQPAQTGSFTDLPTGALLAGAPPQEPDDEAPGGGDVTPTQPVTEPDDGGSTGATPPPPAPPPAPAPAPPTPPAPPPHPVIVDDGILSQAELDWLAEAAIQRWIDAGATAAQVAAMRATSVTVTDMNGLYLGISSDGSIGIDSDGGGHGWFLDKTPGDDGEYGGSGSRLTADAGGPAASTMDLLTVLMHEYGHQLGLADDFNVNSADDLMYGRANLGERRLPQAGDLVNADLEHDGHESFVLINPTIATLPAGKAVRVEFNSTVDSFLNEVIDNPFENYSRITWGGGGGPVDSPLEMLTVDSLTLSGTIWNDNGAGGGGAGNGAQAGAEPGVQNVTLSLFVDANNDDVADAPGSPIATATTNASGVYTFLNLAPGNYLVQVDLANFQGGGALAALLVSPGGDPADPDTDIDNDDNGSRVTGQAAFSKTITLSYNGEPINDADLDADTNTTVDFAFLNNPSPVLANLAGDTAAFTEEGPAVLLDNGANAAVTDDQGHFNGGLLRASITVNEVAGEDVLGLSLAGTVTLSDGTNVNSIVTVGGVDVGTITSDGTGGDDLVITFDTIDATPARVSTLVQALTYSNTNFGDPSELTRTIAVTVDDGLSGTDTENVTVTVTGINDTPDGTDATITMLEDGTRILVAADFGFTDADGAGDAMFSVFIDGMTGGGQLFYDADGSAGAGVGVPLTPGEFTVAQLANGEVYFQPAANENGATYAQISFRVRDSSGAGDDTDPVANILTFDVTAVNDAPENTLPATFSGTEDVTLFVTGLSVSDVDDMGADISVTLSVASGVLTLRDDVGGGVGPLDITNNGTGSVVIVAPRAAINMTLAEMDGLAFSGANVYGNVTLTMTTNDLGNTGTGGAQTDIDMSTLTLDPVADTASVTNATTDEDTMSSGGLVISRNAVDGMEVTHFKITGITNGTLYLLDGTTVVNNGDFISFADANAGLRFDPAPNYFGSGSFGVQASLSNSDAGLGGAVVTATVTVNSINDAPVVPDQTDVAANEQTAVTLYPSITISDIDLDAFNGGLGDYDGALFAIGRAAPSADDFFSFDTTGALFTVNGSDLEAGGQVFATFVQSGGAAGVSFTSDETIATTALVNDVLRHLQYTNLSDNPPATVTLIYGIDDGSTGGGQGTVVGGNNVAGQDIVVTLTEVNDPPIGTAATISTDEDTPRLLSETDFGFTDVDIGDVMSAVTINEVTGGQLFYDADGTAGAGAPVAVGGGAFPVTYTVAELAAGNVSFGPTTNLNGAGVGTIEFQVLDDSGAGNNIDPTAKLLLVDVDSVNDAPTGADNTLTILEDEVYDFAAVDFGYGDVDGNAFLSITITAAPTAGTLYLDADGIGVGAPASALTAGSVVLASQMDGRFYYVPAADLNGASFDSFDFEVTDNGGIGNGGVDTSILDYTIDFNVTPVNDAPQLINVHSNISGFVEDGAPVLLDVGSNAQVIDGDSPDFDGGSLTVSVAANGVAAEDVLGIDTSGTVGVSGTTVSVGGTPIGTITSNGMSGNDLVITFTALATWARVQDLVKALNYANSNLGDPDTTTRSIEITLVDGDGILNGGIDNITVTVGTTITAVNDPSVANDDAVSLDEDEILAGNLFVDHGSGPDVSVDPPVLTVEAVNGQTAAVGNPITLASGARLTVLANGNFLYNPRGRFDYLVSSSAGVGDSSATESFSYRLVDGNTATVTVTINGIDGNDLLIGTPGNDNMFGGIGKDTMLGRAANDQMDGGTGNDLMFGEGGDDEMDGGAGRDVLFGGKDDDILNGGDDTDVLNGGKGADTMAGGADNDSYRVDNAGDLVIEMAGGGKDRVLSTISYTLPDQVENLVLLGGGDLSGRGNALDNEIIGNTGDNYLSGYAGDDRIAGGDGDDTIIGGLGLDILVGGSGMDTFLFNTNPAKPNTDRIYDYAVGEDQIVLAASAFTAIAAGSLGANAFHAGTSAGDADDRILYDAATGKIFYDADGSGAAAAILFAAVSPATPLTHADFFVG